MAGDPTQRAVWRYGWEQFTLLARKVIYRLQRFNASGIYGDDYQHRTLWDEYSHEVQQGPHDQLDSAWQMTLRPFLKAATTPLSPNEKMVLFFATDEADGLNEDKGEPLVTDTLIAEISKELARLAGERNLDQFDPMIG